MIEQVRKEAEAEPITVNLIPEEMNVTRILKTEDGITGSQRHLPSLLPDEG